MAIPQAKLREIIFQLLYSRNMGHAEPGDLIELLMKELSVSKSTMRQAMEKVEAIQAHLKEIDEAIAKTSHDYAFDRIQNVERNILRLGVYEVLIDNKIPPKVAIAEAIRLARKFGTPESASFVNALLDAIYKSSQGEEANSQEIEGHLLRLEEIEKQSQENFLAKEQDKEPLNGNS